MARIGGDRKCSYRILVGRRKGKGPLGRIILKWVFSKYDGDV